MQPRTVEADSASGWLLTACGFLVGFVVLAVLVNGQRLIGVDQLVRSFVHQPGPPLLRTSMEAASFWGGQAGQLVVSLVASAVFWRRRRLWALSLPIIMAGAGIIQLVAKRLVDRPRPNLDPWGFPSAHVFGLVVLLGCIAYVVGTSKMRTGLRRLAVVNCAAIVCTVAYSRMYLDAHWLSDVLGGLSMGLAYLLFIIWAQAGGRVLHRRRRSPCDEKLAPDVLPSTA